MASRLRALIPLVTGIFLMLSSPAFAHVTVNPDEAPKRGFTAVSFRVPNERDDSGTIQLEVEFPAEYPIASVSVKPKAGWIANVEKTPLAEPAGGEGEEITEAVSRITWTGGRIGPGEFDEFDVSMGPLPEDTDQLVFPTVQTYESGEVVRWIEETPAGGEEPEFPAPVLNLTAPEEGHGGGEEAADVDVGSDGDDDDSNTLAVVALVVGAVGLVTAIAGILLSLGIGGILAGRRRPS